MFKSDQPSGANTRVVPVVHMGVIILGDTGRQSALSVQIDSVADASVSGLGDMTLLKRIPEQDFKFDVRNNGASLTGMPVDIQVGGWDGAVDWVHGGLVSGHAQNLRHPFTDVGVVAFDRTGPIAFATADASAGGAFLMALNPAQKQTHGDIRIGIVGSDFLLRGGHLPVGANTTALQALRPVYETDRAIRIKISTPNLQEAPAWGDYHFSRSLQASFDRIGMLAATDTADSWYDHRDQEDVVIALRGRHRFKVDKSKINIMWLISHPDRIPEDEYFDYDHVAVASDIYAKELRRMGVPSVSVLHQATDAQLFGGYEVGKRKPACLFVGNSRREYRTMVKWCLDKNIPLELYGGGWEGILPPEAVRATNVPNADLPQFYGGHLIVLNDHWDSMRENGFLSNRLFDASGVGTPIVTDKVLGLADVFADTISAVDGIEDFAEVVADCLENPEPYLARAAGARDLVLAHHTFDHRARQIADLITQAAQKKPPSP